MPKKPPVRGFVNLRGPLNRRALCGTDRNRGLVRLIDDILKGIRPIPSLRLALNALNLAAIVEK